MPFLRALISVGFSSQLHVSFIWTLMDLVGDWKTGRRVFPWAPWPCVMWSHLAGARGRAGIRLGLQDEARSRAAAVLMFAGVPHSHHGCSHRGWQPGLRGQIFLWLLKSWSQFVSLALTCAPGETEWPENCARPLCCLSRHHEGLWSQPGLPGSGEV